MSHSADDLWIVYDGDCPFCSRYTLLYRLRENGRRVHLIDARGDDPLVAEVRLRGLDLDEGMVVRWQGRFYHGAAAMQLLARLGGDRTAFGALNRRLFANPRLARRLYPWLARGRRVTLWMLGRKPLG